MNTKIIKLNINKPVYGTILAKQGDTQSRFLLFKLLDNSIPFNLLNRTVRVYAIKPDGTEVFNDLVVNDTDKGYCTLELTSQMLALAGIVKMELVVTELDKKLTSIPFDLEVLPSINSDNAIVSTNEFTALINGLASLSEYDNYKNEISEARKGHETVGERLDNFDSQLDTINAKKMTRGELISIAQLDKNQGKLDESYMSESLLQMITGETPVSTVVKDGSVTQEKMEDIFMRKLYKQNTKVFGGITNIIPNNMQFNITTTPITIYNAYGQKWSFNGVTDYTLPETGMLVCDIVTNEPGGTYDLTLVTDPLYDTTLNIVIAGNFYGKLFSDATLNIGSLQSDVASLKTYKTKSEEIDEVTLIKSSMIAIPYTENLSITFNTDTKLLSLNGQIYIRKLKDTKSSFIIPSFSKTLSDNKMIYVAKDILKNRSDAILSESELSIGTIYEDYDPSKHIPLFWQCYNNVITSTQLKIDIVNNSTISGKNIAWFGDSISELQLLPHRVGELLNANVYDCSFAGSVMTYRNGDDYEKLGFKYLVESIIANDFTVQEQAITSIETTGGGSNKRPNFNTLKSLDFNNIDIVVTLLGTNDFGASCVQMDDNEKSFAQGMRDSISKLLAKYPHLKFYIISPIWRGNGTTANSLGYKLIDYVNKEEEVANEFNFPFFNLYRNCSINSINKNIYLNSDNLHQNEIGDMLLADKCYKFIKSN